MFEISFLAAELTITMIWLLVRVIVWIRQKRIVLKREAVLLLMYINLTVMIRFIFFPRELVNGHIQPLIFDSAAAFPLRVNFVPFIHLFDYDNTRDIIWNVVGNAALFIPSGIVLPVVYKQLDSLGKVVAAGAFISFCIEILQLPFATTLAYFEVEDYVMKNPTKDDIEFTVTQDAIPNYSVKSNEKDGNTISIVNEYDKLSDYFQGHSLSLNGDIGVNFYIKLTPEEFAQNAKVHFEWFNKSLDVNITADMLDNDTGLYKVSCPVAVAEMTYNVYATLTMGGNEVETDKYSVVKYANVILSDKTFHDTFIAELKNKYGEQYDAEGTYVQLITLVLTMLDYGAKAQLVFERDVDNLANGGYDMFTDEITADDIKSESSNMSLNLENYGLEYQYSSIVFLSGMSLRHFYKITDQTKYDSIKSSIKFIDEEKGEEYAVTPVKRGEMIYFQKKNISASQLDNQYSLVIGSSSYKYSVLDGIKAMMESKPDENSMKLCQATYRYNQAANNYFGD